MIFYWNVASTRFDLCYNLVKLEMITGRRYHLKGYGMVFNIFDLDADEQIVPEYAARSVLMEGSTPLIFEQTDTIMPGSDIHGEKLMENPFTCLRPCSLLEVLGTIQGSYQSRRS